MLEREIEGRLEREMKGEVSTAMCGTRVLWTATTMGSEGNPMEGNVESKKGREGLRVRVRGRKGCHRRGTAIEVVLSMMTWLACKEVCWGSHRREIA